MFGSCCFVNSFSIYFITGLGVWWFIVLKWEMLWETLLSVFFLHIFFLLCWKLCVLWILCSIASDIATWLQSSSGQHGGQPRPYPLYRTARMVRTSPLASTLLHQGAVYEQLRGIERPMWFNCEGHEEEEYMMDNEHDCMFLCVDARRNPLPLVCFLLLIPLAS